ncbi:hypothetical protein LguiA_018978 [Lonicera macranthoides]
MDSNNWRPTQGGEPPMDTGDWRTQLQADSRHRIVNKIMETLKRHLPFSGQEGLQELKKIAVRFEEKIYTTATSQSDYLRKISLKMLTMGNKSNPMPNAMQSNSAVNSKNSPDPDLKSYYSTIISAECDIHIQGKLGVSHLKCLLPPLIDETKNASTVPNLSTAVGRAIKGIARQPEAGGIFCHGLLGRAIKGTQLHTGMAQSDSRN